MAFRNGSERGCVCRIMAALGEAAATAMCAGNINQLVLKADSYAAALERTGGVIAEFVNPKYKDDARTAFKSSTRLECMMQDFPHGLPPDAAVGFTVINQVCNTHCLVSSLLLRTARPAS